MRSRISGRTIRMKLFITRLTVPIATVLVLVINYFAAVGMINGRDPKTVSDAYPTGITPAGYAFTIWSIIYFGMIGFSIYQLLPSQKSSEVLQRVRFWYLALSLANIGWIFAWHYDLIPLSMLLMLALLIFLAKINVELIKTDTSGTLVLVKFPFALYFGWVTVATVLNAAITLVYLNVTVREPVSMIAGVLVVVAVAAIGSVLRFKLDSIGYPLAIAWGVTAIGINQSGNKVLGAACAFAMMTLLFVAFWGYVKDR